jgi:glycosyltransferase involved in cell wall biosynthesis
MSEINMDLPPFEERPLVTFALFAYNQEKYIREAIEGAFSQTYEPLEIILSDDCSTDRTFEIIEEMAENYKGPHSVVLRRPEQNKGLARGISETCSMARGSLIVAAAGDDISSSKRVYEIVKVWERYGKPSGSLYSHFRTICPDGVVKEPGMRWPERFVMLKDRQIDMLNNFSGISGCAHAWTKDLFDIFGAIDDRVQHEDVVIPLRAILNGSIIFIPLDLVDYRLTLGSITRKSFSTYKERIKKMAMYWSGRVAIFEQFDKDAEHALARELSSPHDIHWLCEEAAKGRSYAQQQFRLYVGSTRVRLFSAIHPAVDLSLQQRIKWFIIALMPWLYGYPMIAKQLDKLKRAISQLSRVYPLGEASKHSR